MRIRLTKQSDRRHRLELVRDGRVAEGVELETRSTLLHDLAHHAVESAAGLDAGFFGLLARGHTLEELSDRSGLSYEERFPGLMEVEQVVGALHALARGAASPEDAWKVFERWQAVLDRPAPAWVTPEVLRDAARRLRASKGHWASLGPGESMELEWR